MAKEICIFCGEPIGFFKGESVLVGKTTQMCCSACAKEVQGMDEAELCRHALSRGYAGNKDKIQARLDLITKAEEARPKCLSCGGSMKFGGRVTLDASPMRDSVFSATFDLIPAHCPNCFRMEFFSPEMLRQSELMAYLYSRDT